VEKQASDLYLDNKENVISPINQEKLFKAVKQLEKTDLRGFSIKNTATKTLKNLFISKQISEQGIEYLSITALYKNHWLILDIADNKDLLDLRVNGLSWSDWHSMDHSGFDHYFDRMGLYFRENYKDYLLQVVKKSQPVLDMINSRDVDKQGSGSSQQLDDTGKQAIVDLWNAVVEYCPPESDSESHRRFLAREYHKCRPLEGDKEDPPEGEKEVVYLMTMDKRIPNRSIFYRPIIESTREEWNQAPINRVQSVNNCLNRNFSISRDVDQDEAKQFKRTKAIYDSHKKSRSVISRIKSFCQNHFK
jgi:hypothetical protein